jgi:hypothetical protein
VKGRFCINAPSRLERDDQDRSRFLPHQGPILGWLLNNKLVLAHCEPLAGSTGTTMRNLKKVGIRLIFSGNLPFSPYKNTQFA